MVQHGQRVPMAAGQLVSGGGTRRRDWVDGYYLYFTDIAHGVCMDYGNTGRTWA